MAPTQASNLVVRITISREVGRFENEESLVVTG